MRALSTGTRRRLSLALVALMSTSVLLAVQQGGAVAQPSAPTTSPSALPTGATTGTTTSSTADPTEGPSETPTGTASPTPTQTPTPTPTTTPTVDPGPVLPPPTVPPRSSDPGVVRIAHANLRSGMSDRLFREDVATIIANQPDFITYNEVVCRWDSVLAPPGYDFWRPMVPVGKTCNGETDKAEHYMRYNVVAWRTDLWQPIDRGTWRISQTWGKGKNQSNHWGVRFANWVTLQHVQDGRTVNVVSAHFAPPTQHYPDLLPESSRRLGRLTQQLSASGPVIVGGDLNVGYRAANYPRAIFDSYGLAAAYDLTGVQLPTGNYNNATIDYILVNNPLTWKVNGQWVTDIHSDHNALTADLVLPFGTAMRTLTPGTVKNKPKKGGAEAKAVVDLMVRTLNQAPKGAQVRLHSRQIGQKKLVNALVNAHQRGVKVKVITHRSRLSKPERRLFNLLGRKVAKKKSAKVCVRRCAKIARNKKVPPTRLVVDRAGTESTIVIGVNRPATTALVRKKATATITVGAKPFNKNVRWFTKMERAR